MAAYLIATYRITDPEGYASYVPAIRPTLAAHGVEVLAADYRAEPLEGAPGEVAIILKFTSKEAAHRWYESPEYQAIMHLRTDNSEGAVVLAEGFVRAG